MSRRFPIAAREVFDRGLGLLKRRAADHAELLEIIEDKGAGLIETAIFHDGECADHFCSCDLDGDRRAYLQVDHLGGWAAIIFDGAVAPRVVIIVQPQQEACS